MSSNRTSLIKKVINVILNIFITIFTMILLVTIYTNVQLTLLKNSYASFFGYSIFEVQTGSMEPAIAPGDCVIVKYSNDYDLGDIITYQKGDEFITHRVIEAYKGTYVTEGDANNTKDDPISREQIVGKVIKTLPKVGLLRKTILNPAVLIALIITLYLISLVFKDRKRVPKNKKEEVNIAMKLIEKIKQIIDNKRKSKSEPTSVSIVEERIEDVKTPSLDSIIEEELKSGEEVTQQVPEEIVSPIIDISEDKKEAENQETSEEDEIYRDDELDKTMYFRMVPVDEDELNKSYKDILKNEEINEKYEKKEEQKRKKAESKVVAKIEKSEEEKKDVIVEELERLQKKKKKFKNIIEKAMFIKEEEVSKIVDILLGDDKTKNNFSTIKNIFIKTYIDAKYYNYCGNINVEYNKKNMTTKLNMALEEKANDLIKSYKGSDKKYAEKVDKIGNIFNLIIYLEQMYLAQEGIRAKRENYKGKILKIMGEEIYDGPIVKEMVNDIIEIQKTHSAMIKLSIDKLDTNTFKLVKNHVVKNIDGVYLEHNIAFSKVYSDYIVDKTYSEGVIAEDKIAVLLTLLSQEILNDMFACNFNQKYLIYIPESLYTKSNKLSAIFDKFEDEYAKICTVVLVQYEELSKNTKVIRSLIKEGYKFAVDLSKTDKIKSKDMGVMELMSSIFMDRKTNAKKEIISSLSLEAQKRVIYDEIESKIGNFWGK